MHQLRLLAGGTHNAHNGVIRQPRRAADPSQAATFALVPAGLAESVLASLDDGSTRCQTVHLTFACTEDRSTVGYR